MIMLSQYHITMLSQFVSTGGRPWIPEKLQYPTTHHVLGKRAAMTAGNNARLGSDESSADTTYQAIFGGPMTVVCNQVIIAQTSN